MDNNKITVTVNRKAPEPPPVESVTITMSYDDAVRLAALTGNMTNVELKVFLNTPPVVYVNGSHVSATLDNTFLTRFYLGLTNALRG